MARTRLLVVDDHPPFRQGLAQVLLADHRLHLVGQAATAEAALPLIEREVPDIILCDIDLPGMDGLTLARHLQRLHPQIRVIMVTLHMDAGRILAAVRAGAAAFLTREASGPALLAAIDRVMRGEYPINDRVLDSPQVASYLLAQFRGLDAAGTPQIFSPLTARELELLQTVASGQSHKEIARTLRINDQTVKDHVTAILRKLAVNDRTQAVIQALGRAGSRSTETAPCGSDAGQRGAAAMQGGGKERPMDDLHVAIAGYLRRQRPGPRPERHLVAREVAIYARVATLAQGTPVTLDMQVATCRAFAAACGDTVGLTYREVADGPALDRPRLTELRAAIAHGWVAAILVTGFDRLTGDSTLLLALAAEWAAVGVDIVVAGQL